MTVQDHLSRHLEWHFSERIVSLCPSQTETLFDLGVGARVVGTTRFCVHPAEEVQRTVRVGGTKKINLETVRSLRPDLILAEKEENTLEIVEQLSAIAPVFVTNVESYEDGLKMIRDVGRLTNTEIQAAEMIEKIKQRFSFLKHLKKTKVRGAYLIWKNPYMAVGSPTYIDSMLECCGIENIFSNKNSRYPTLTLEDLQAARPDLILLSSEPFPFQDSHKQEFQDCCPDAHVLRVDGEMFSWYGSRMLLAASYFENLLTTEIYV